MALRSDQAKNLIRDLTHGQDYSPEERRAYYLRTRQLKGRAPGSGTSSGALKPRMKFSKPVAKTQTVVTKNDAAGRQAAIKQKVGKLKQRLDELNKKLAEVRDKARKKDEEKGARSPDKDSSGTVNAKDQKPLTAAEKADKAKKEKERYDKEEKVKQPETEKEILAEIRNVESKIRGILSAARNKSNQTDS